MQIYLEGLHWGKEEGERKNVRVVLFARNLMVYVQLYIFSVIY